jgi:exodeoxyribonuclease VII large subunit
LKSRLAVLSRRLVSMLRSRSIAARRHIEQLARSRVLRNPQSMIFNLARRLDELDACGQRAIRRRLAQSRDQLASIACRADALSPLAVLGRGYSVTTDPQTNAVLTSTDQLSSGQRIRTRLKSGSFESLVDHVQRTTNV